MAPRKEQHRRRKDWNVARRQCTEEFSFRHLPFNLGNWGKLGDSRPLANSCQATSYPFFPLRQTTAWSDRVEKSLGDANDSPSLTLAAPIYSESILKPRSMLGDELQGALARCGGD